MEKKQRMDEQKDEQNTLTCPHVCTMQMLTFVKVLGTHKIIQTHPLATVISITNLKALDFSLTVWTLDFGCLDVRF